MFGNWWHKKEMPMLGSWSLGGGVGAFKKTQGSWDVSGGTITTSGIYTIHTFTHPAGNHVGPQSADTSQTLVVTECPATATMDGLVVGGGGGGGRSHNGNNHRGGGGGGAGGVRCSLPDGPGGGATMPTEAAHPVTAGTTYPIQIGHNGKGGASMAYGGDSSIFGYVSQGGGRGGDDWMASSTATYTPGGSGGGCGSDGAPSSPYHPDLGGRGNCEQDSLTPVPSQGKDAGAGGGSNGGSGGGGAVGAGGNRQNGPEPGQGGTAKVYDISGSPYGYGGGGGGGAGPNSNPGAAPTDQPNGGSGGAWPNNDGTDANAYGCGGGGSAGGNGNNYGGAGCSGVVVVRYSQVNPK